MDYMLYQPETLAAASGVAAKDGYASVQYNIYGQPATRERFEEIIAAYWDGTFLRMDYSTSEPVVTSYIPPTTEDLQRLYDGATDETGDPSTINAYVFSILAYDLFLQTATDPRWQPYVKSMQVDTETGNPISIATYENTLKASQGVPEANILRDLYTGDGGIVTQAELDKLSAGGQLPASGGLPPTDPVNDALIEIYIGYFNRAPEFGGLEYWRGVLDEKMAAGTSMDDALTEIANQFWPAAKDFSYITGYTEEMSTFDFVAKAYSNVLGRPDAVVNDRAGIQYWADEVDSGSIASRGELIIQLIDGAHSYIDANPSDSISIHVDAYLSNRTQVASLFAQEAYSGQLTGDASVNAGIAVLAGLTDNVVSVQDTVQQIAAGAYADPSAFQATPITMVGSATPIDAAAA
jgi:hypothetical protein